MCSTNCSSQRRQHGCFSCLSSKAYKKFPKHGSWQYFTFHFFLRVFPNLLLKALVVWWTSKRSSPALHSSLQEHFPGDSSLLRESNWMNMLVTSLHTQIHTGLTCSKPSAFPRLNLSRILASLTGLNWCVSLVGEPLFQIWNNHILSQAQTLLHSWKTPIPRRILPFCLLSKKVHWIWQRLDHAGNFHHFPEFTTGNSDQLNKEEF